MSPKLMSSEETFSSKWPFLRMFGLCSVGMAAAGPVGGSGGNSSSSGVLGHSAACLSLVVLRPSSDGMSVHTVRCLARPPGHAPFDSGQVRV